ncbi:putative photosynthetic complex assembly protein PuhE [Histidinibacterium aquaticum]|uniref:DUF3623 domain-containing protein n=1 Tax=Histidinibacterium aquaticum TaxID=2613962 RepID=A0A5J5GGJ5_9RHOB|nr:putative photosynthetic complex assembly protein PuhE [Histidinibacterium aquaticum]KAA9006882.1 DUF3623 domain-containing protein [Histidinibacterium aquaticum]
MSSPWIAALTALFAWWFSTGAILLVVRRSDRTGREAHAMSLVLAVPLLALGAAALIVTRESQSVAATYAGFAGALAIWGWIELSFLSGVVTGPDRRPAAPGLSGSDRFAAAWGTVAHHEVLLLGGLAGVVLLTTGAADDTALWTYAILFVARIAAKLNLFLGVPRINLEFVPSTLSHLKSHMRQGPVTLAFPVAVTLLTFATGCFAERLISAPDPASTVKFALLTAISALALLEHWFMVLPLPDARLWRWMLPAPRSRQD